MSEVVHSLFSEMIRRNASDLHLRVGRRPMIRVDGVLQHVPGWEATLNREDVERFLREKLPPFLFSRFERENELDFSYRPQGEGDRFRCNLFRERGELGLVFRRVSHDIPTLDGLRLPSVLKKIAGLQKGLVIVAGPTGAGKSTTLAAMIHHINETEPLHIITIEDPIEYEYRDIQSIIDQREIGLDTATFTEALRRALRQDPDVILLGEMRDAESMTIATSAAETGHLVLTTLHTNDAKQSVSRIVNTFPIEDHFQVRMKLSMCLEAVICQQLLPRKAERGGGRVAVMEILLATPFVRQLVAEGRYEEIDPVIERNSALGMQTMNQDILNKWLEDEIDEGVALAYSLKPHDLRVLMDRHRKERDRRIKQRQEV